MVNKFSIFQESVPSQYQDLFDKAQHQETTGRTLNKAIKVVEECSMKEMDTVNACIDQRGKEVAKIDEVVKTLGARAGLLSQ